MIIPWLQMLRFTLVAIGVLGYDLLAHYSNSPGAPKSLGAALAILPLLLIAVAAAWRSLYRWPILSLIALVLTLSLKFRPALEQNFALIYVFQQCGIWLFLFFTFARTLSAGQTPLCSRWADMIHGPLSAEEVRYTRQVTTAWCLFFASMGAATAILFCFASVSVWSAFANFWAFPLTIAMFTGEYAVRRLVLPHTHRAGLFEAMRLYASRR